MISRDAEMERAVERAGGIERPTAKKKEDDTRGAPDQSVFFVLGRRGREKGKWESERERSIHRYQSSIFLCGRNCERNSSKSGRK